MHHLAAALVLSFALVLLPSIAVQAPNAGAFATPTWQVLLPSLLAFLAGWAALALLSLLTSWSPRLLVGYLVAAVAALLCSQVFGQAEGLVLDGARHELTVPWGRAVLELAVLAAVAAAGLVLRRRIAASAGTVVLVVGAGRWRPGWCRPRAMPGGPAGRVRLSRSRPCPATSTSCT